MALTEKGDIYSWGCNEFGQLALDVLDMRPRDLPTKIAQHSLGEVAEIACGANHRYSNRGKGIVIGPIMPIAHLSSLITRVV